MTARRIGLNLVVTGACGLLAAGAWGATTIYRSVGPGKIDYLAAGLGSISLTISGSTATFGSPLPTNVGVGDALLFDINMDGTPDGIVFIHGRTNSTTFTIMNADGTPNTLNAFTTFWRVYRSYTSLYDAERGTKNTGISIAFETFSGGKDITAATGSDEIWTIACYADAADNTRVVFSGWTTDATHYIRIYTPYSSTEVGTSQRHSGVWSTSAYRLEVANEDVLTLEADHVRVEGLQIHLAAVDAFESALWMHTNGSGGDLRVSDSIFRGVPNSGFEWHIGIVVYDAGSGVIRIWNNLVYDFNGDDNCEGMEVDDTGFTAYVYNNTVHNCRQGIQQWNGTMVAKNDLVQSCTVGFGGSFSSSSDYNISEAGDAPGTNSGSGSAVFLNETGDDFHLSSTDTVARNMGTDLSTDANLPFSDDVDLQTRSVPWDIGADEYYAGTPTWTPTATRTATRTFTPTATPTGSPTRTRSPTRTATPTATRTATPTGTITPTPSLTPLYSPTASPTATRTFTATRTLTATPTTSPTPSATRTITSTFTHTPTRTASRTATATGSPTSTPTATRTHTATPSVTVTPSITLTSTVSPTVSATSSVSPTLTVSPTRVPVEVDEVLAYPQPASGDRVYFYLHTALGDEVGVEIFNVAGESVTTLSARAAGSETRVPWDLRAVAPGVYLYRALLRSERGERTTGWKKLVIVKN